MDEIRARFKKNHKTREMVSHSSKVHSVDWSCDGKKLASGSYDKTVCIFSLGTDRLSKEHVFKGHGDSVDQLCWHPTKPDMLATASGDKTVRVWDARSNKAVTTVTTKGENINITWSPDGHTIAVGNKEDLVTFIDSRTYKVKAERQFKFEVNEISWNMANDLFFLTNGQGCIEVKSLKLDYASERFDPNCLSDLDLARVGSTTCIASTSWQLYLYRVQQV